MKGEILQERVRIASARGSLAGELAYPCSKLAAACLVVNPHPYMGGHMNNNVVTAMAADLAQAGLVSLRFDYAGVGESAGPPVDIVSGMAEFWATGHSPYDAAMYDDASCAAAWLRQTAPLPVVLVGYSFGCQAMQSALGDDVAAAVLISPTLVQHDLSRLAGLAVPRLVIYSDNDFATPRERTESWCAAAIGSLRTHCIPGANHFFKGREDELTNTCREFIAEHLTLAEEPACRS